MRAKLAILAICAGVAVGVTVRANEKPTEAYQKAMKDLNAANNSLRGNVKTIDYDAIAQDGAKMQAAFKTVLEFWTEKKAEDAIKLAQTGLKGAVDVEAASKAKSYDAVLTAFYAIQGNQSSGVVGDVGVCAPCHQAHRVRLIDGTYEIK